MWFHQLRGSLFTLFFILLNLIYLIIELSFNARVLDVSASLSPDTDFGQMEIYGRTIAAAGATILAWRLLMPYQSKVNFYRLVLRFFVIGFITFPLVFIAQKKLVDDLVDLSTAETRRSAEILSLLKYGIANGFVEIEELAVDELTLQTAEGKMFITLVGLLAYNSTHIKQVLEENLETIASYAIATQQTADTRTLYRNYSYVSEQVLQRYQQYMELVQQLEDNQSKSKAQAELLYQQAMNYALLQWLEYQKLVNQNVAKERLSSSHLTTISRLIRDTEYQSARCSNVQCFEDNLQKLEFNLSQLLGVLSPVDHWCDKVDSEDLQRGIRCITGKSQIEENIIQVQHLRLAQHSGLSRIYQNKLDYLKSSDFRSAVFSNMREKGIEIQADWRFSNYSLMLDEISEQLSNGYLEGFYVTVEKIFGNRLQPRATLQEFSQIESIQSLYRQALGGVTVSNIKSNLGQQQLGEQFIVPLYQPKLNSLLARLQSDTDWYTDEAPYEQVGKNSLRNLLVPPVAILFSLVFGLLNLIILVLSLVFLLVKENRILRWAGFCSMVILIFLLPMNRDYQIYNQHAYHDLLAQAESNHGSWALLLDGLARTEPLVYPFANILRYNVLNGFDFD